MVVATAKAGQKSNSDSRRVTQPRQAGDTHAIHGDPQQGAGTTPARREHVEKLLRAAFCTKGQEMPDLEDEKIIFPALHPSDILSLAYHQ